tara:strand:- start:536 stop:1186 length:651 start_codon:yes stop_codon:yes gene_type:complete
MNNLFILLVFASILILYSQYITINTLTNTKYEIIQGNNPDKDTFEDLLKGKNVVVLTNIFENIDKTLFITDKLDDNEDLKIKLLDQFRYYHIPMTFTYNFKIENEEKNSYKPIIKESSYRHLIVLLKGLKKIIIFNPKQKENLHTKNNQSLINFWEGDKTQFSNYSKLEYIEIVLKDNQMIYIPYGWWYSEYNMTDTSSVSSFSESVFSYIFKKKI